ncbi:MAG: HAD family hydrolase [Myxococcota bacterium]
MAATVLLFDVDGTLITTGGAGRRAMAQAFGDVCGDPTALESIRLGGRTDRSILREGLGRIGREFDETLFVAIVEAYLVHLAREVGASTEYHVMEGAADLLRRCAAADVALGLGTGNVRRGAEIKLERGDLAAHFGFGGFGDDAEDRGELLRAGARRGASALKVPLADCRVVVVGDTPRDIDAAAAIGAECVAVATGGYGAEELQAYNPALVVESLADGRVESLLIG